MLSFKTLFLAFLFGSLPAVLYGQTARAKKKPPQVWSVKIEGNKTFSSIHIKDQIATEGYSFMDKLKFWNRSAHKLQKIEVKKDVIRIRNFYNQHGFPNTTVNYRIESKKKEWKKKVIFIISEKAPVRIKKLTFDFSGKPGYRKKILKSAVFKRTRKHSGFQVGKRYQPVNKEKVSGSYTQLLKNMGFAYAKVNLDAKIDTLRLAADVTIHADLGPMAFIHHISVKGDSTVSDRYVIRQSGLKKGEKFSLKALRNAQRQIFDHHLFQFVTINIPDQPEDSTLDLAMNVRERPLRTVKTSIGFGTRDYLRGRVSWVDRNPFGRAHKFSATARASFIEQSLSLDYLFPYVFNPKSSFVISPLAEHLLEPGYELFSAGVTNSFIYQYSRNLTASVSYKYARNDEHSPLSSEQLPDTTQSYNVSSLQFSGYFNQGFGRINHKGWVIQPFFEISGFLHTSTYNFQKLSLDVRRYTPLTKTTTLVTRVQGGKIFAAGIDSLPHNIRDYLGGTSSVRGWYRHDLGPKRAVFNIAQSQNPQTLSDSTVFDKYIPIGGRSFFSFNLEIRQGIDKLIKGFGLAAFLDGGQLWRRGFDFSKRPLQFGAGGGVRYNSPIGPVRLYVGYKVNPTDKDLDIYHGHDYGNFWNRIAIHVSIGEAF
jgi:outer membrane protein insertion porin family